MVQKCSLIRRWLKTQTFPILTWTQRGRITDYGARATSNSIGGQHVEGQTIELLMILFNNHVLVRDKDILGRTRMDASGAIQLTRTTLAVAISDLLASRFASHCFDNKKIGFDQM